LRPRRHDEPHQGVPGRPVRRPHLDRHPGRQPAQALARLVRLYSDLRGQARRPRPHSVRRGHMRHIRLKLLARISARRIKFALASACPYGDEWRLAPPASSQPLMRRRDAEKTRQSNPLPSGDPQKTAPSAQTAPGMRSPSQQSLRNHCWGAKDQAPPMRNAGYRSRLRARSAGA
jgi:hypothetical protein